jgi:hypothetical protein
VPSDPGEIDVPERPADLPDNFNSVAELVAAHKETQAALTRSNQAAAAVPDPIPDENPTGLIPPAVVSSGLERFHEEYSSSGELSPSSYEDLLKDHGISRELVDHFIAGQEARGHASAMKAQGLVGGPEEYGKMVSWAQANLSSAQIEAFNSTIEGGQAASTELAVRGLYAQYASGGRPRQLQATQSAAPISTSAGFASDAEMVAAMQSPKYNSDPEYTRSVQERVSASPDLWKEFVE